MKKENEVIYICKKHVNPLDGGAIYDRQFVKSLDDLGYQVSQYDLDGVSSFPFWSYKVDSTLIKELKVLCQGKIVIVSHESLYRLCKVLEPNLFIVHNYFAAFKYSSRLDLQFYYRFGAKNAFDEAFKSTQTVLFLSEYEHKSANRLHSGVNTICEPPGVREYGGGIIEDFDDKIVYRLGSSDWYPKKASLLDETTLKKLASYATILSDDNRISRGGCIIEDKFISGFKLKLIDALSRGDFIISNVDLSHDLESLGVDSHLIMSLDDYLSGKEIEHNFKEANSLSHQLSLNYSWVSIVTRVMEKVI